MTADLTSVGVRSELDDPLSAHLRARRPGRARLGHEGVVLLEGGETTAPKGPRLYEGDVDRCVSRIPVVERVRVHAGIAAVVAIVDAGLDPSQAIHRGAVFDLVLLAVRSAPGAAERIAETVRIDVVGRRNPIASVVEGVVRGRRAIEVHAQDLA